MRVGYICMRLRSPATNFLLKQNQMNYLDGHLSLSYGFFPTKDPYRAFPPSHQVLNDVMIRIPEEMQKPSFREFVRQIPQASIQTLPEEFLPLAAAFYSVIAHAYWNCRATTEKPELPGNIKTPWEEVSKRLDRSSLNMDIVDLFINNWYVVDKSLPEAQRYQVENMDVIIPTFANQAERVFYLTFVEMT